MSRRSEPGSFYIVFGKGFGYCVPLFRKKSEAIADAVRRDRSEPEYAPFYVVRYRKVERPQ